MTETDQLVGHVSVGGPSTSSSSPPVPRAATHHLLARTAGCPPAEWSWPTALVALPGFAPAVVDVWAGRG